MKRSRNGEEEGRRIMNAVAVSLECWNQSYTTHSQLLSHFIPVISHKVRELHPSISLAWSPKKQMWETSRYIHFHESFQSNLNPEDQRSLNDFLLSPR